MAMKPNYRQERQTRERAKNLKKQDKLRRREEESTKRKILREGEAGEPEKS